MITATVAPKKKLIDLKEETFKSLSVMAIHQGTNLKRIIEKILDEVAIDYEETLLYEHLSKSAPEGKQKLDMREQDAFENWLGV